MRLGALYVFFLLTCGPALGQELHYAERVVGEGELTFELPETWKPLTQGEIRKKSMQQRPPIAAYKSPYDRANLTITINETPFAQGSAKMILDIQKANVMHLYDGKVRFFQEAVKTFNGREYAVLEFTGRAEVSSGTTKRYNYLAYTVKDGKLMVCAFDCLNHYKGIYQPAAHHFMETLKVK